MARLIIGRVTSDKSDKTIVVTMTSRHTHPLYKKQYTVNAKFMAHDEANQAKVGDRVQIRETRPLSARKRFTLDKILETSGDVFMESDAEAGVELPEKDVRPAKAKTDEKPEAKTEEKPESKKPEVAKKASKKDAKEADDTAGK